LHLLPKLRHRHRDKDRVWARDKDRDRDRDRDKLADVVVAAEPAVVKRFVR
jgi:hypothetical protein